MKIIFGAFLVVPSDAFSSPRLGTATSTSTTIPLSATWSNGQAIREYNDFLATGRSTPEEMEDGPSVIITNDPQSPLVRALFRLGDGDDVILAPGDALPSHVGNDDSHTSYPIYLCIEPRQLQAAMTEHLFSTWEERQNDLVYVSPPNQETALRAVGLPRDTTSQLLVGFTTPTQDGFRPLDSCISLGLDARGEDTYAFESVACGKWKDAVAARLEKNDIRCRPAFYRDWRRSMWERSVFDAVFHLIGVCVNVNQQQEEDSGSSSSSSSSNQQPLTIAQVADYYADDAEEIAWQLSSMLRGSNAIALTYGFEERMFTYAQQRCQNTVCTLNPDTWDHINGVFLQTSIKGLNMGFGDPAPLHTEYVRFAYRMGLLHNMDNIEMPPEAAGAQRPSIMRQGNLRADGVI